MQQEPILSVLHPARWGPYAVLVLAAGIGAAITLSADLKLQLQLILAIASLGVCVLLVFPHRRIALVCAWAFAHPLSLEKVFPIFQPDYPGFLPPTFVLSGSDLIFAVLVVSLFAEALFTREKVFFWPKAALPFALLVGWAYFVFFFASSPSGTGVLQLMHWAKMLVCLVVFSSALRTREEILTALVAMAAAVFIQSAILLVSYVLHQKIGFSAKVTGAEMMGFSGGGSTVFTRATGTVGHVNQQAMFHTFFTIPLAALFVVRNWAWRVLIVAICLLSVCSILLTFSRASWIACGLAACIIVFLAARAGKLSRASWRGLAIGGIFALVIVACFSPLIYRRLTQGDDGASSSRLRAAKVALGHLSHHPLTGVGPGNFVNAKLANRAMDWSTAQWLPLGKPYLPRDISGLEIQNVELQGKWYQVPGMVHNKFLLISAELGLVGLSLFVWFLWRIFAEARRALAVQDALLWWVAAALMAVFCASLIEYNLEFFYDDKTVLIPLFTYALIISLGRIVSRETQLQCP